LVLGLVAVLARRVPELAELRERELLVELLALG
jgi:hypothetical protein